jgi:hypothetical protein
VAVAVAFIDAVNHGDVEALGLLMSDDHSLQVFDEPPLTGRARNIEAWHGYVTSFPNYVIYPHRVAATGSHVAVVGHTTASHLELPAEEEEKLTLIWVADVQDGVIRSWRLIEDTGENRHRLGLDLV